VARLGVEVVSVRQDHGVALHGEGLVVAGVYGALGDGHDGARSVLESHCKSHHASVPGLVPDNSLVVLGDVGHALLAPGSERRDVRHILVVHSGLLGDMGSCVVPLLDPVDLGLSESSSSAPVLDYDTLRFDIELGCLLTSELCDECSGAAAHLAIETEAVDSSA